MARKALEAGVDMDMEGDLYGTVIASQVRAGKIPEVGGRRGRAPRSCASSLRWASSSILTPPQGPAYEATPERRAAARKVADETFVLLKNDPVEGVGALLPLAAKAKKVALIGPLADNQLEMLGAWAGHRRSQRCGHAADGARPSGSATACSMPRDADCSAAKMQTR